MGTVASSGITYIFPAVAYLTALRRYGKERDNKTWQVKAFKIVSYCFILIGLFGMVSYFTIQIGKLTGKIVDIPDEQKLDDDNLAA